MHTDSPATRLGLPPCGLKRSPHTPVVVFTDKLGASLTKILGIAAVVPKTDGVGSLLGQSRVLRTMVYICATSPEKCCRFLGSKAYYLSYPITPGTRCGHHCRANTSRPLNL